MGLKDTAAKNFFGRPEVLACLLEYVLPKVMGSIQEDKLRLVSGEYYRILKNEDGQYITDNLFRDQLFEYDNGREVISIGLEYQSQHDRNMVLRIMGYDLRRYNDLQKEGRMHRIINIVLEFEQDGRTGPCELNQMMPPGCGIAEGLFYNYGFVSLNIYDLAEKYEQFCCEELKKVLYYFKVAKEGGPILEVMASGHLSRDAAYVCIAFLDVEIELSNEMEDVDMCKAVDDCKRRYKEEGRTEGLAEGMAKGMAKGRAETVREVVTSLLKKHCNHSFIKETTNASEELIQEIALSMGL